MQGFLANDSVYDQVNISNTLTNTTWVSQF